MHEVSDGDLWPTVAGLQYRVKTESALGPIPGALHTVIKRNMVSICRREVWQQ